MSVAKKAEITIEEAVATLIRSTLPSVIAEGADDFLVLRGVEERCADVGVSIFPVGGKDKALRIWEGLPPGRRETTLVIVDRDMWLFEGTPGRYQVEQIFETNGFSIENDLRADWDWEALMSAPEKARFVSELGQVCRWFSCRVARRLAGEDVTIADHPNQILNDLTTDEDPMQIEADYVVRLRGKTLIELAVRQLSGSGRAAKHSKRSLMEMAASVHGRNMRRIEDKIRGFFNPATV